MASGLIRNQMPERVAGSSPVPSAQFQTALAIRRAAPTGEAQGFVRPDHWPSQQGFTCALGGKLPIELSIIRQICLDAPPHSLDNQRA